MLIRIIILILVSMVPVSSLRLFLYRKLFGFKIAKTAKIAMFNLLDIKTLIMEDHAEIRGIWNIFMSMHRVEMREYSRIGGPRVGLNLFRGTSNKKDYPSSMLKLGRCSLIELFHYFDFCGDIIIGDNVVIGGIKSVFLTHTMHKAEFEPIIIGDNTYIGTNCLFQMGTSIPSNSVVGVGSVVIKPIEVGNSLIAGVPARVVEEKYGYCAESAFKLRKKTYYKDGKFILPNN